MRREIAAFVLFTLTSVFLKFRLFLKLPKK